MTSRYKYLATYCLSPPRFIKLQEIDDEAFGRGYLRQANTALMNNTWRLTVPPDATNDPDTSDPLSGLCRLGMLDLLGHNEEEEIVLVITMTRNLKMARPFINGGRKMNRMKTEYLVVKTAKVKQISEEAAKSCEGFLEIKLPEKNVTVKVPLNSFCEGRKEGKKAMVEIWKSIPDKPKQVSSFLDKGLSDQTNPRIRTAVYSFLLSESIGDSIMSAVIAKVYYQYKWGLSTKILKWKEKTLQDRRDKDRGQQSEREMADEIVGQIDELLKGRAEEEQSGFIELCKPLLSRSDLMFLHNLIKEELPQTYNALEEIQRRKDQGAKKKRDVDKFRIIFDFIVDE
ncbi:unnamed protein product [Cylindrotheca closterium]|uniref:Uncharacterized protein n=1 Tax=Cylindrotheca closterium TaxID=2856 RepID=A0AAD2FPE2_9STRA|nr:unnamed protein product [Cylindrotheca closterium]